MAMTQLEKLQYNVKVARQRFAAAYENRNESQRALDDDQRSLDDAREAYEIAVHEESRYDGIPW